MYDSYQVMFGNALFSIGVLHFLFLGRSLRNFFSNFFQERAILSKGVNDTHAYDSIMVMGGINHAKSIAATVDMFDGRTMEWVNMPPLLVMGGYDRDKNRHRSVEMYQSGKKWIDLQPMHEARSIFASCIAGRHVYVAGGQGSGFDSLSSAECFDLDTRKWTQLPSMKRPRRYVSGALLPDGITFLVTGGEVPVPRFTFWGNCDTVTCECEQFNTVSREWSHAPRMIEERYSHCTVRYKDKVVVIGGVGKNGGTLSSCD